MSDIQRYEAYISGVCESGCGESMNDNGEYVKYDDHIAEIEQTMEWAKSSYAEMKAKLQAEVETTEQLKIMYKNQLFEAEARIAELEESHLNAIQYENDLLKIIETQGQLLNGRTEASIKAEGIRERFHAIKALMDGKGNDPFREGYLYALELFIEYADKLLEAKQ